MEYYPTEDPVALSEEVEVGRAAIAGARHIPSQNPLTLHRELVGPEGFEPPTKGL